MTELHKSLRLGDLLVEKGLITPEQLREAVNLQQERRLNEAALGGAERHAGEKYELGEILIELGFINSSQLKANLSWQRRLKRTTAIMVFVAPLLTAACGGGGAGGGSTSNTGNTGDITPSTSQSLPPTSSSKSSAVTQSSVPTQTSSSTSSLKQNSSPSSAPSSLVSSSKSSANSSSKSSTGSSKSSAASSGGTLVNGPVQLLWTIPNSRSNGDYLDITEIGGYELRYKKKDDANYTNVVISDSYKDTFYFEFLQGDYQFEIAAFDVNGLYSEFVRVEPN